MQLFCHGCNFDVDLEHLTVTVTTLKLMCIKDKSYKSSMLDRCRLYCAVDLSLWLVLVDGL
jgi:hypothetical protein